MILTVGRDNTFNNNELNKGFFDVGCDIGSLDRISHS